MLLSIVIMLIVTMITFGLLRGNLGFSWTRNQSVASLVATAQPKTIALVGLSTLLALVVAIPMGIWQAVRRNKLSDHTIATLLGLYLPAILGGALTTEAVFNYPRHGLPVLPGRPSGRITRSCSGSP